jgi:hypothetical protein
MRQMAFDHISIPAMSAETERVFSDTKLFISDLRSRLGREIIEALECISPAGHLALFFLALTKAPILKS